MTKKVIRISRDVFASLPRPRTSLNSAFVTIRVFPLPQSIHETALLVTISKKEIPTAVKRNFLRRRYRAIVNNLDTYLLPSTAIQCLVKKPAGGASFQELSDDLSLLLRKISS